MSWLIVSLLFVCSQCRCYWYDLAVVVIGYVMCVVVCRVRLSHLCAHNVCVCVYVCACVCLFVLLVNNQAHGPAPVRSMS